MNLDRQTTLHEMKAFLAGFCKDIGCSMMDKKCPGNPNCCIVRKAIPWIKKAPYRLCVSLNEVNV